MAVFRRRPQAPLDAWVESLWTSERGHGLPHAREWGLPTGRADIVVPLNRESILRYTSADDLQGHRLVGGLLQGVQEQAVLRDTSSASIVVGAHFRPNGLAGLFNAPAHAWAGSTLSLDELWPGFTAALQQRIDATGSLHDPGCRLLCFEEALGTRLRAGAMPDAMVSWACLQLAAGARVGDVQRASGSAAATFIARYKAACGLTPKRHAALMRFQRGLHLAQTTHSWSAVAAEAGYADQSHLTREFTRMAGLSPGRLRRNATEFLNHLVCC